MCYEYDVWCISSVHLFDLKKKFWQQFTFSFELNEGYVFILGSFGGSLSSLKAHQLGCIVISEVLKRANVNSNEVSEVILGQVNKNIYNMSHFQYLVIHMVLKNISYIIWIFFRPLQLDKVKIQPDKLQ